MDFAREREGLLAAPLYESLWPVLRQCAAARFPAITDLDALANARGVRNANGKAIRFVAEENSKRGEFDRQYEIRVYREGAVPTRPLNWHDLFNALAWISFPSTKAELNRIHYREMITRKGEREQSAARRQDGWRGTPRTEVGSRGTPRTEVGSRGTPRDVATLFDEGGVIVACGESELARLLREFRWKDLFWWQRERVRRAMRFFVFGHAIQEKALHPYKGLTAKALIVEQSAEYFAQPLPLQLAEADAAAARYFCTAQAIASTRNLSPLPVSGVPGWNPANEHQGFYDDASVFRPGRVYAAREKDPA